MNFLSLPSFFVPVFSARNDVSSELDWIDAGAAKRTSLPVDT